MRTFLTAILICLPSILYSQQRVYTTNNKEALKTYFKARQSLDYLLYDQAITQLTYALSLDPNFLEAQNQLADLLRLGKKYKPAVEHYLKLLAVNAEFNRSVYLNLGESEVNIADYTTAQTHLQKYLQYPNITEANKRYAELLISDCTFSIQAIQHPVPFKPTNLGPEINTKNDEYMPVITADESTLIFTRKINNNEDFYKSTGSKGKWANAVYLSKQINTPNYNEGAQSITQDGQYLFFTGCDRPEGLGKCDIYVSKKQGNDWDIPYDLAFPLNTGNWESQPSISSDGRTLYFVSNRKGGYGGYDIWKSTLTDKGWAEPVNLGPNINTPFDEQSPFIHPDDNTLYFSSNGWPGLGNMDVFISRRGNDGAWQKPDNLGYPINTNADDSGLTLNANGNLAYFSSDNLQGYGGFDIYSFEMPAPLRPQLVTYVKGFVTDAKSKQPIVVNVEIVDLQTSKTVYLNTTDGEGQFLSTLTSGKDYGLNISKKGYLFYSENFSLHGLQNKKQFQITVPLQAIETGNKVILKNIFFDTNKYDIKDESKTELAKLIAFLNDNPSVKIEVSGHTDNVGVDAINQTLSQNRAKAVYQYLIGQHISPNRLVYKGYGKAQPIAPNTNEEGRKLNRRTEFKIII
ncbi:OmpA family protein [Mucilaginibacter paludis]|uniref:OmpA/MotB domain protein n=1 Tax=Mucilaginibacter paludis DSM 18603 TaxID=714943 RepID=H1YFL5_9SPHI|nr:OmpA family protein [Mucilaginibacter paludis]EHQ24417.1 OmpA/MotB domain protein [Mucilaginibacter paludis DSM 18603]